jgi:hypothetical protein
MAGSNFRLAGAALAALTLAACATLPAGPSLPALPGSRMSHEQFAADDARCRAFVSARLAGGTPTEAANQAVAGSAATGAVIGATTGAVFDGGAGAAAGAAAGLLIGAVAGSAAQQGAWAGEQQQFDGAYYACMYALGHKVPAPAGDVARYRAWLESAAPPLATAAPGAAPGP